MAISMLKIRRPLGRLIFNMGIAIPGKTVFLIETAPCSLVLCVLYRALLFGPDSLPMGTRYWHQVRTQIHIWGPVHHILGCVLSLHLLQHDGKKTKRGLQPWNRPTNEQYLKDSFQPLHSMSQGQSRQWRSVFEHVEVHVAVHRRVAIQSL